MSQHPSLRSSDKGKQHRSVLKRYERIKTLSDKEKWDEKESVFGLQKVKVIKFKVKKEKAAPEEAAEGEAGLAEPAAGAAAATPAKPGAAPAKPATPAKGTGKDASKPSQETKK